MTMIDNPLIPGPYGQLSVYIPPRMSVTPARSAVCVVWCGAAMCVVTTRRARGGPDCRFSARPTIPTHLHVRY